MMVMVVVVVVVVVVIVVVVVVVVVVLQGFPRASEGTPEAGGVCRGRSVGGQGPGGRA